MTEVMHQTPPPAARRARGDGSGHHRSTEATEDDAEALADAIRDAMYLTPRRTPSRANASVGGGVYNSAAAVGVVSSSYSHSSSSASSSSLRYAATPTTPMTPTTMRTPTSTTSSLSSSYAYGERDCAVCHSPLDRTRPEASDDPEKHDLVTGLTCRHVFHKCCLVQCRAHDIQKCPTCQQPLPRGFTPEAVREERNRNRMRDRIIARSRRATDAIRLARARAIVNGGSPATSSPGTPGYAISLSQDTGAAAYAAAGLPPLAPRTCERSAGAGGGGGRHHPYSPASRSPSSEDDEFFVSLTQ